ncbi:putative S-norcoclaurine synthase 1 [Cocos nucifera]|uniref:Putative S-norcoclaurine synthase 1 n=1 Tax=Cocos nucifera TaxID=13894 RepID=A0A8K0N4S7_COCNU|nr:putative S-norcoclaurine synthase 1 [Cocos nucifera]
MESVGSLPVANVQALAAASDGLNEVPPRYLRPEAEADPVARVGDSLEVPVIDMSRLLQPELSRDESAKLNLACEQWGFFQVRSLLVTHQAKQILGRNLSRAHS